MALAAFSGIYICASFGYDQGMMGGTYCPTCQGEDVLNAEYRCKHLPRLRSGDEARILYVRLTNYEYGVRCLMLMAYSQL